MMPFEKKPAIFQFLGKENAISENGFLIQRKSFLLQIVISI